MNFITCHPSCTRHITVVILIIIFIFRGKYICSEKNSKDVRCSTYSWTKVQQKQLYYEKYGKWATNIQEPIDSAFENHGSKYICGLEFPGYFDRGTPLIIDGPKGKTVIGIFKEILNSNEDTGPNLYFKINHDIFNWITKNSDGAYDSDCTSYTSCLSGIQPSKHLTPRRSLKPNGKIRR